MKQVPEEECRASINKFRQENDIWTPQTALTPAFTDLPTDKFCAATIEPGEFQWIFEIIDFKMSIYRSKTRRDGNCCRFTPETQWKNLLGSCWHSIR